MGDYTRLKTAMTLKSTTPAEVVTLIDDIINGREISEQRMPEHHFFKTDNWSWMLTSNGGLGYFPQATGDASLTPLNDGRYMLTSHSSFKNYDRLAEAFCAWIAQYLDAADGDAVGEIELYGSFGKRVGTLIVQPGRIDTIYPSQNQ